MTHAGLSSDVLSIFKNFTLPDGIEFYDFGGNNIVAPQLDADGTERSGYMAALMTYRNGLYYFYQINIPESATAEEVASAISDALIKFTADLKESK